MPHVRGHYRRDGSYVRPHYRRSRGASADSSYVRSYVRSDGTRVRGHHRTIAQVAGLSAGGFLLFVLVLLLVANSPR